jgi:protease I
VHPARVRGHVGRGDKPRISFYQAEVAAAADLIALFKALVVSLRSGEIKGWNHKEWGETMAVDKTVDSVDAKNCDALLLPGGVMNPDTLRMDAKAVAFVKAFFAAKKPVAAICHGPWTIVEAGAAKGRTLTSWPSLKTDIQNAGGGGWVDQETVVDDNLFTSRNPKDIPAFNREVAKLFATAQSRAA